MKTNIKFKRYINNDPFLKKEIWFYYDEGNKGWWLNGNLHREDGPAIEWNNGTKYWYLNGNLHREEDYWKALEEYKKRNIKK